MTDIIKKGLSGIYKRNSEQDKIHVHLEASLNLKVSDLVLEDNYNNKRSELNKNEGIINHIFVNSQNPPFHFKFGNFDLEIPKTPEITKIPYQLYYGQVNLYGFADVPEAKNFQAQDMINPSKNTQAAFNYTINDNNQVGPLKQVNFNIIQPVACCDCKKKESEVKLYYCLNDKQYFCTVCDKNWHEQKEKKALTKHLRTPNYKYSLTYFGNCPIENHLSKPYQYFNKKAKVCLCVKCVDERIALDKNDQEIDFIEDYLTAKKEKEDFLSSKLSLVCNEIKEMLKDAEDCWNKIDTDEKNCWAQLDKEKNESINRMKDEGFARSTFLACVFMEIQRIITEIDSKVIFNKNQKNNVDVSTFLYMNSVYSSYMKNELSANLDFLSSTNIETFSGTLCNITVDKE